MNDIAIETPLPHANFAGFWVRFFAACIDMVLYMPFYYATRFAFGDAHRAWAETVFGVFGLVTYAMFFASRIQASPGMYILKFHVSNTEGDRMSFMHAFIWGVIGSIGWIICFAGFIYMQSRFDVNAVNDMLQSCTEQNVAMEDCTKEIESIINIPYATFVQILFGSLGLALFLMLIWALSIGMAKDKSGFNNLLSRTRFIKGRV